MSEIFIYCDGASDEMAAERFLSSGLPGEARIERLPSRARAPECLKPLLLWERLDWVIVRDNEVRCAVELSRHGYTGDNGFQRFARLFRSASLGIPTIYFTPFSRTRLNEVDEGHQNARNVAPELFETLAELEQEFGVPCLAINWPVDSETGQPLPLDHSDTAVVMERTAEVIAEIIAAPAKGSIDAVAQRFPELLTAMHEHSRIPYRGGATRGEVELPLTLGSPDWVYDFLPSNYFEIGKAEMALAYLALDNCSSRPIQGPVDPLWATEKGQAWVQYLGYQWRPDPSCGLIALSATKARLRSLPLIVVWPRVFLFADGERLAMLRALEQFKESQDGPLADEMRRLGRGDQIDSFSERISVSPTQFGVLSMNSKVGRVLRETTSAVVLGDAVLTFDLK